MTATLTEPRCMEFMDEFISLIDRGDEPMGFEAGDANLYRYVGNSPVNMIDPSGLMPTCNPDDSQIRSGEAVHIGDDDRDGKPDYEFPRALPGGYKVYCYSKGGRDFYIKAPDGSWVHRCPYPGGINSWRVDPDGSCHSSVVNPKTRERITYDYDDGVVEISVIDGGGRRIRHGRYRGPRTREGLPHPGQVPPHFERLPAPPPMVIPPLRNRRPLPPPPPMVIPPLR